MAVEGGADEPTAPEREEEGIKDAFWVRKEICAGPQLKPGHPQARDIARGG